MPLWDRGIPCLCGGKHVPVLGGDYSECERVNCPRAQLGDGSWHKALPKLQELNGKGLMRGRYPDIDLNDVIEQVFGQGAAGKWRYHRYQRAHLQEARGGHQPACGERMHELGRRWDITEQERRVDAPSTGPQASSPSASRGETLEITAGPRAKKARSQTERVEGVALTKHWRPGETVIPSDEQWKLMGPEWLDKLQKAKPKDYLHSSVRTKGQILKYEMQRLVPTETEGQTMWVLRHCSDSFDALMRKRKR